MEKTILVMDRGMVSLGNLEELDNSGFDYICGLKKNVREVRKIISEVEGLDKEGNMMRSDTVTFGCAAVSVG